MLEVVPVLERGAGAVSWGEFFDRVFCAVGAHDWQYSYAETSSQDKALLRVCACCLKKQSRKHIARGAGSFGSWISL